MGKGDPRTRKGKIVKGTYGNSRLKADNKKRFVKDEAEGSKKASK